MRFAITIAATCVALQLPAQTPVFRSRLDVIRTEVAVIDNKTGKAVTGLTERDFTIAEGGKRQTISSFVDESSTGSDVAGAAPSATADDARRRVFLFILTPGQLDGPYKVADGVARFIREQLRPQDLVGVMALSRVSLLTTDHERVAAVVERLKTPPKEIFEAQRRDRFRGEDFSMETERLVDEWLEPPGSTAGFFKDGTTLLLGTPQYRVNSEADIIRAWKSRLVRNDVLKTVAGIEYLRRIPGEKHLVLVSVFGFNPPVTFVNEGIGLHFHSADDDRRLAAQANDAGVAVDIIQTAGATGSAFSVMSNANVSEHSGGQFSGVRTAIQQLGRIDDASRHGYILGYVPVNPELDGKQRSVTVTVSRKDVTVVYRRSYTAVADPGHIDSKETYTRTRIRDAAVSNTDLTDFRIQAKASPVTSGGVRQVKVDVTIDISKLPLTLNAGRWEGEIDLLILCGDAKQNVVGKLDQHMSLSMTPAMYETAKARGVPYSSVIPVTGSPTLVKAVVYHFDSDRLGTASASIR